MTQNYFHNYDDVYDDDDDDDDLFERFSKSCRILIWPVIHKPPLVSGHNYYVGPIRWTDLLKLKRWIHGGESNHYQFASLRLFIITHCTPASYLITIIIIIITVIITITIIIINQISEPLVLVTGRL